MVFSSLVFLFAFLPIALAFYFLLPRTLRNASLFLLSLFFYAWGEPFYLLLMLLSLSVAYALGIPIGRTRENNPRLCRFMTFLSVAISLSFLFFFKYYNFFAINLSRIPTLSIPVLDGLRLPIGISFYTFQIISYTVDVYRGDCRAQSNYIAFGTYVTLFPQLIAGPIVRYHDIDAELVRREESVSGFCAGISRFVSGLSKKVLLGDVLAAGSVYFASRNEISPTVLGAWMEILFYSLHLYYDFSGYSDMAIGLGRMFGFHFPENFRYPYIAQSLSEFWRRWHISLSTWFREYVYIPLGGNREGKWKCYRNLAIVWLLTGFWHGANWNFVLWGVYFAILLILERMFLLRLLSHLPSFFRHLYAIVGILLGFVIFSHTTLTKIRMAFLSLFGFGVVGFYDAVSFYQIASSLPLLVISILGATPLPHRCWERMLQQSKRLSPIAVPIMMGGLVISVCYLVNSTFSPFEYTQF